VVVIRILSYSYFSYSYIRFQTTISKILVKILPPEVVLL